MGGDTGIILISQYATEIASTDIINSSDLNPILQGLFGEVGGIMSTVKKHVREKSAYLGFRKAAEEEFGDTLWYLAALCRRLNISLDDVFNEAVDSGEFKKIGAACDYLDGSFAHISVPVLLNTSLDSTLLKLGKAAAVLLDDSPNRKDIVIFIRAYLNAVNAAKISFSDIVRGNLYKAHGAFVEPQIKDLINLDFDKEFDIEEQLPREFKIRINQRRSGKSYLQWNGVFIGSPLTDNISDPDGYRFHDVFHLSYAAILHWSPVIRALIKHKRKSRPSYDEEQDSGRAIVVEEGLTAWIFSKAKELNFFENQDKVSLGMLKTIGEFVNGYEVQNCPLKLWERAILDSYAVFRELRANNGGWIIGNRDQRTIKYMPLEPDI
ncbi:nucleoside triphosphate pyrophosphohydrolase family protein [Acinetobacter baumannii]|uniref:nucleoside triphosphate pyrophosphohydrolase family protein n=1 Tax=Acinetobacter baumannii TaxID=470 RepID=UPI003B7F55C0